MSLRRMISNNRKKCNEKPTPYRTTKTPNQETNSKEIAPTKEREVASDYRTNDKPSSNTNDPLKRNIYFLNKVSPKHKPHTNYKIMSQQHDDRDYPDYNLYENDDSELYYDDMQNSLDNKINWQDVMYFYFILAGVYLMINRANLNSY